MFNNLDKNQKTEVRNALGLISGGCILSALPLIVLTIFPNLQAWIVLVAMLVIGLILRLMVNKMAQEDGK